LIRFGVIGTNWITDELIASAAAADGFVPTAVCSRTEERAAEFAAKHQIPHTFTDVEKMAASGVIDAVYIASPNALHAEQAILCMKHGLHVLCEKPAASNAREFREMAAAAKKHRVVLMEAMKSTVTPNFAAVRENLHKIGTVRRYAASFCQYSSRYDAYKQGALPNAFNPAFSNGALMDLGTYCIYPMVVLFGKPRGIKAQAVMLESGVDGQGSILFEYPGMEAAAFYSKIADSPFGGEIQGENGTIVIDKISRMDHVELRFRGGAGAAIGQDQSPLTMVYEVNEFVRCIRAGKLESDINSHAHSEAVLEIMDEARRQIGLVYPADRNGAGDA